MKTLFFSLFTLIVCHQLGCSSIQVADPNSAEGMFKIAEQLEKDERFEEAITKFNELRNKHPYSRYATEAELRVADIHFKKEAFIESATAYQLFKDFHPKHPRNDYVTYKIALSYFNQLPSTIDRDLTPAFKAISAFKEVESSYSTSEYFKEAQTKKNECIKMLAEKELYIANFYFIRDIYDSALKRFESLITKFPNRSFDEEALYKAGISAFETGQKERGEKHIRELLKTFPNGSYSSSGKNALEKYGSR
ncbi:MAG: outer membrane protein assembly factor BamD [Oligoflexia bacterium]|nr:outer membrane protein assembly factor BamD [Oligoflexia bacterium]